MGMEGYPKELMDLIIDQTPGRVKGFEASDQFKSVWRERGSVNVHFGMDSGQDTSSVQTVELVTPKDNEVEP